MTYSKAKYFWEGPCWYCFIKLSLAYCFGMMLSDGWTLMLFRLSNKWILKFFCHYLLQRTSTSKVSCALQILQIFKTLQNYMVKSWVPFLGWRVWNPFLGWRVWKCVMDDSMNLGQNICHLKWCVEDSKFSDSLTKWWLNGH